MPKILIVDDNPDIIEALDLLLTLHGHQVISATNKMAAVLAVSRQKVDLVIQDMNFAKSDTSGEDGLSLFYQLRNISPNLPIVLITAWSHLDKAVELVKAGAADYLQKPWDDEKLLATIAHYCQQNSITPNTEQANPVELIVHSPQMLALIEQAKKIADSDINVLITGANGAGKEKIADLIHAESPLRDAPFIKVNMGALPQELMEAELFGAEKGAFTGANEQRIGRFEAADGGILFLDEIGNLPLSGQMKLLRVLQSGEFEKVGSSYTQKVNVRVISATNADLNLAVKNGEFREDLYYRLNVIELSIPSLKQRKEDILPLAKHFIGNQFQLSDKAKDYLIQQDWPGNVRQLENACKRAKIFANDGVIDVASFGNETKVQDEQERIRAALDKHQGVIKYAAQELGMSRQSLYRRIEKYNIELE